MDTSEWMSVKVRFRHIIIAGIALVLLVVLATIGFMIFEDIGLFDAFYLTFMSLMTVGYGDLVPETMSGRRFSLVIIPLGVAVFTYATGAVASYFIEQQLSVKVLKKRMEHTIKNLEDHVIVCGMGRVGRQVYQQLKEEDIPAVYIHDSEEEMLDQISSDTLRIVGSPLDEGALSEANVEKARGLIAAMPNDSDNVFITIKAKALNDKLEVVSRAENMGSEDVLLRAGASHVVNPSTIGGRELVSSVLHPEGTYLVNLLIHTKKREQSLEEIKLDRSSEFVGQTLEQAALRKEHGVTVLGIRRGDDFVTNPGADEELKENDVLIIYGEKGTNEAFKKKAKG